MMMMIANTMMMMMINTMTMIADDADVVKYDVDDDDEGKHDE